ncbi:conserved Plasmodium protein, unknown function [Plasmodium sp. gorilla clade G2]|uniref:conserved Plasmodium protein, unknown function n=1 Tax=Plasmodium sp. gorilla clade G2 TaxID=880535 RepID=UPI000D21B699|nr:conserved Plasmodium protein, unknown function [Plasmodium sp. gorilla clade G2]SOV16877.1 conserved Plasmodium protein, unknown function [Plasmodium sp. gorilla clade G2]
MFCYLPLKYPSRYLFKKYIDLKKSKNIFLSFPYQALNFSSSDIKCSPQLIIKCVNETYKSKCFNKIKWKCIQNDIIKNTEKFNITEIIYLINILSRLHIGSNVLIHFIPNIVSKLNDIKYDKITQILICYIKANIRNKQFYYVLCSNINNNIQKISYSFLIKLLYTLNFYSYLNNDGFLNLEKKIIKSVIDNFKCFLESNQNINNKNEKYSNCINHKKDTLIDNTIDNRHHNCNSDILEVNPKDTTLNKNKNITMEQSSHQIIQSVDEKNISYQQNNVYLKNYNFILLFYSLSNYLFHHIFKEQYSCINQNDYIENKTIIQLKDKYIEMLNKINEPKEIKTLDELNIFHTLLLYKSLINIIYISDDDMCIKKEIFIFNHIHEKISNKLIINFKNDTTHIKGKTNELIKYMQILQQNIIQYMQKKKDHFQFYFKNNILLIKNILTILQEKNKNDIKRYYLWHREKIEMIQKMLRQVELESYGINNNDNKKIK